MVQFAPTQVNRFVLVSQARTIHTRITVKIARILWTFVALFALGVSAAVLLLGDDYFVLDRAARHHAPEHETLGPGGSLGHMLGIVGSAMMVANLLYLVRRRWARIGGIGSLQSWLAFHVALGVGGVALVFAHAALLFDNPIARVSLVAALIVLVTGVVGRWIYAQVPHRPDGGEMDEAELVAALRAGVAAVSPHLRTAVEDAERALARVAAPPVPGVLSAALQALAAPVTFFRFQATRARWAVRLAHAPYALEPADRRVALSVAADAARLRRRFRRQSAFKHIVGAWRGVHRIATFVMLLTLVTHVVTVLYFAVKHGAGPIR